MKQFMPSKIQHNMENIVEITTRKISKKHEPLTFNMQPPLPIGPLLSPIAPPLPIGPALLPIAPPLPTGPPLLPIAPPLPIGPPPPWNPVTVKQKIQGTECNGKFRCNPKEAAPERDSFKPPVKLCPTINPPPPPEFLPQLQLPPDFVFNKPPPIIPQHNFSETLIDETMHSSYPNLDMIPSNPLKRTLSVLDRGDLEDLEVGARNPKIDNTICIRCNVLELCRLKYDNMIQTELIKTESKKIKINKLKNENSKRNHIIMQLLKSYQSTSIPISLQQQWDDDNLQWEKLLDFIYLYL